MSDQDAYTEERIQALEKRILVAENALTDILRLPWAIEQNRDVTILSIDEPKELRLTAVDNPETIKLVCAIWDRRLGRAINSL